MSRIHLEVFVGLDPVPVCYLHAYICYPNLYKVDIPICNRITFTLLTLQSKIFCRIHRQTETFLYRICAWVYPHRHTATNTIESHFACRPYVETLNPEKKSRNFLSQETFESETILCVNARGIKYKRKFQLICMAHATSFIMNLRFITRKIQWCVNRRLR